jgi:probable rRNA maturation factor
MTVNLIDDHPLTFDPTMLLDLAELVLSTEGFPADTTVDITTVEDDTMSELNRRHLGVEGATDVLSFPLEELEPGRVPVRSEGDAPLHLGDVVLAPRYIARQAEGLGVDVEDEHALLVVHGLLHLMGWDHQEQAEAEAMETREAELLSRVGISRR